VEGKGHYRAIVVDGAGKVAGVISGRRILELILGKRGSSIRAKKDLRQVFLEPVNLFMDELHQIFLNDIGVEAVLKFMAENRLGYLVIVDQSSVFRGILEEANILKRMRGRRFGVTVGEVMRHEVYRICPDASLLEAAHTMVNARVRRLPVVMEKVVGIITVNDVLRHMLAEAREELIPDEKEIAEILGEKVEEVMIGDVVCLRSGADVGEALEKAVDLDVSGFPVASEDGRLIGILSRIDIIEGIVRKMGSVEVVRMMGQ